MTSPVRLEIIRASCNNCAKSKVRCSKDQPSCQRCLYQGVPCVYSPSQRSRKRPPPTPSAQREPITQTPKHEAPTITMTETTDETFSDGSIFVPDMSPMKWSDLLEFDTRMSGICDASPLQTPDQPQIDLETGFPWPRDTEPWLPHQTPHQCSQLAMSAIQRLDVPMESCPSLGRTHQFSPSPRSFDNILKDSHSSLEDLLTILACPCTAKIDLIFLITTSCTRVLSWYQASLDRSAACPGRDTDGSESSGDSIRSRSRSVTGRRSQSDTNMMLGLSRSFHEWVSIPSINVGAYTLEPGQTRRMVAQLILAEIDKVKEVLAAFNRSYCRQGDFGEDDEKGLHMALEAYLRHQMKTVALTARENLN
ncbi:unnamed protein product [Penicillium olsonii]|uniref:Zn(2)-C6 fungal-type domain-containing protein n=1 Tax=Penicillium olsonii TaxID=99116 RepID=A0A9W4IA31_PENOL|nr:unnamed protein product [Penicillium olsonii]CAG8264206.1 unnamed protein product [Penicillium olsonii]